MNKRLLTMAIVSAAFAAAGVVILLALVKGSVPQPVVNQQPPGKPAPSPVVEPPPPGPELPGPVTGECRKTGCSGQICVDEDVVTTCEYRAEYACYKNAICERQADGKCGWTETPQLMRCLANPPQL